MPYPRTFMPTLPSLAGAVSLAAGLWLLPAQSVVAHEMQGPITAKPLTQRAPFDGTVSAQIRQELDGLSPHVINFEDASNLVVVEFTIQPGAVFPWHTHPGTVLINVTQGELVFIFAEDCRQRPYGAGNALIDPGNTVHTAFNPGDSEPAVVIATLLGAPDEGPLMLPVESEKNEALDKECGIERDGEDRLAGR
jgi:quercetin dioxygenase-like cupin family protein